MLIWVLLSVKQMINKEIWIDQVMGSNYFDVIIDGFKSVGKFPVISDTLQLVRKCSYEVTPDNKVSFILGQKAVSFSVQEDVENKVLLSVGKGNSSTPIQKLLLGLREMGTIDTFKETYNVSICERRIDKSLLIGKQVER